MEDSKSTQVILFILLVFSLLGIADAGYLTYEHYTGGNVVCLVTEGCDEVITSKYSTILGFPVALFGLIYYFAFFAGLTWLTLSMKKEALYLLRTLVGAGLLFSAWFVYAQIFLINAICFYCMISAGITTLSFIALCFLRVPEAIKNSGKMVV